MLLYNLGRVFTYGFLGIIVGKLGEDFHETFEGYNLIPAFISIIFGIILVIIGAKMFFNIQIKDIPFLNPITDIFSQLIKHSSKTASIFGSFLVGLFNGFIPCPIVYAFLIKASSTLNPIKGMEIMVAMGLGTFPGMFLIGRMILFKESLTRNNWLLKIAGLIICYLGVMSIMRGIDAGLIEKCCEM